MDVPTDAMRLSYVLDSALPSVDKAEQAAREMAGKSGFDEETCGLNPTKRRVRRQAPESCLGRRQAQEAARRYKV